jgi:Fic family protein
MAIRYQQPDAWAKFELQAILPELTEAKAAVLALTAIPFQRSWAERLQAIELKREVAGTSRIEGADFTERELDEALAGTKPDAEMTRSQRQARAAIMTYSWIAALPADRPIDASLIKEIHRRIVTGCDDDHCQPGQLRSSGENVAFGRPVHRGVEGGRDCADAFARLCDAVNREFRAHDPLIRALALHYHLGAMHPFQDGNGRTARALEALMLRRSELKDALFVAMSNYYYDEKGNYLAALSAVRERGHDLTPFLKFGLAGIALQCKRLLNEIKINVQKTLFRDVMSQMYGKLRSSRKRAMGRRQCEILGRLLEATAPIPYLELHRQLAASYASLAEPLRAYVRDLNSLVRLHALTAVKRGDDFLIAVRLDWATEITETAFFAEINALPSARTKLMYTSGDPSP